MDVKNEKGQGLIEFLIFLPFMLMMYSVSMNISNSINASINQQKITRAFFYYRNMNNSTIPKPRRDGQEEPANTWQKFGMEIMGWSEFLAGDQPVAPCFKFLLPLGESTDDECEESYSGKSSQFIRVQTVYGVCGASYEKISGLNGKETVAFPRAAAEVGSTFSVEDHCTIRQ